jgi:hypothetical protein
MDESDRPPKPTLARFLEAIAPIIELRRRLPPTRVA